MSPSQDTSSTPAEATGGCAIDVARHDIGAASTFKLGTVKKQLSLAIPTALSQRGKSIQSASLTSSSRCWPADNKTPILSEFHSFLAYSETASWHSSLRPCYFLSGMCRPSEVDCPIRRYGTVLRPSLCLVRNSAMLSTRARGR